jgi:hypothetical protein
MLKSPLKTHYIKRTQKSKKIHSRLKSKKKLMKYKKHSMFRKYKNQKGGMDPQPSDGLSKGLPAGLSKGLPEGLNPEYIYIWRGVNALSNSYINYKILLKDEWKTDSCKFIIGDKSSKESKDREMVPAFEKFAREQLGLKENTNIPVPKAPSNDILKKRPGLGLLLRMPSKLDITLEQRINLNTQICTKGDGTRENCIVTIDSKGDYFRCHEKDNYFLFKEGAKIKIPKINDDEFTIIKIINPKIKIEMVGGNQKGGNDEEYFFKLLKLDILDKKDLDELKKPHILREKINRFN